MIYDITQIILFQDTIEKNTLYIPEFFMGKLCQFIFHHSAFFPIFSIHVTFDGI